MAAVDMELNVVDVSDVVATARAAFDSGMTRSLAWRSEQLGKLQEFLRNEEEAIYAALKSDLGRSDGETYLLERWSLLVEITNTRKKLRKWAAPRGVSTPLPFLPGSGKLHPEPLGVVLAISPWNYPMYLTLAPLIGMIAAGNCAVLKPSELAPATSEMLATKLPKYLDSECFPVVQGGVPETTSLLEQRYDHICYTGGSRVARIVMSAAAKHLTPVTLELGGKSPCIVDKSADIGLAAKRIAWGKFINAGQTCVAPDYILTTDDVKDELVDGLQQAIGEFFGSDPKQAGDFSRIINESHFDRLTALIDQDKVAIGGTSDRAERYIAPTVMIDVSLDDAVMQEEIFGPILPIIKIQHADAAIDLINQREKPLALYLFHKNRELEKRVLSQTSSGGVTINHTVLHVTHGELPFGGVGESGMGVYHGKRGFDNFSHLKPVFKKSNWPDPSFAYAPFDAWKRRILEWCE